MSLSYSFLLLVLLLLFCDFYIIIILTYSFFFFHYPAIVRDVNNEDESKDPVYEVKGIITLEGTC